MSCTLYSEITELNTELKKQCNNNSTLISSIQSEILNEDGSYSQEVRKYLSDKGIDIDNIPNDKIPEAVQHIRDWYNDNNFDPNYASRRQADSTQVGQFGYTCVAARGEALQRAEEIMINIVNVLTFDQHTTLDDKIEQENDKRKEINKANKKDGKKENISLLTKRSYLAQQVKASFQRELLKHLINLGISSAEAKKLVATNDFKKIDEIFEKNYDVQASNVYAVVKELSTLDSYTAFFDSVFDRPNASKFKKEKNEELELQDSEDLDIYSDDDLNQMDYIPEESQDNNNSEDKKDKTIQELNNKDGSEFTDFMSHIDEDVRMFFDTLKRQNSIELVQKVVVVRDANGNPVKKTISVPQYDTDNFLGMPSTMSARDCIAILYSYGDFTNLKSMIESIRRIARNIRGYEAFNTFADYLEGIRYNETQGAVNTDNNDFAFKVYSTFAKAIVPKLRTEIEDGRTSSVISNRNADKLTCLRFEYVNSIKTSAISVNPDISREGYKALAAKVAEYNKNIENVQNNADVLSREELEDEIKKYDDEKKRIMIEFSRQFKRYYPTFDDIHLAYYLDRANEGDFRGNCSKLLTILSDTISGAIETDSSYRTITIEISKRNFENYKLRQEYQKELSENGRARTPKYLEVASLRKKKYISSKSEQAAFDLAQELKDFVPIKTELNSPNVEGNISSDVLNNSMITNVINTLKSTIALKNFGKYKSQSRQYDFSNIMIEHTDDNGEIINYGLFRHNPETDDFEPTPYAYRLVRATLFNGASNMDNATNATYSKMSRGDYTATAFINFFRTEPDYTSNEKDGGPTDAELANYFMRIPSDAPKNFIMRMPKVSIGESEIGKNDGLIIITNKEEVDKLVNDKINEIPILNNFEFYNGDNETEAAQNVKLNQVLYNLTSKEIGDIKIWDKKTLNDKNCKEGDVVRGRFAYEKDNVKIEYILEGTVQIKEGQLYLSKPKLIARNQLMPSDVYNGIKKSFEKQFRREGKVHTAINTNHILFKQFRQLFIQELTDAANALNVIFVNKNGMISRTNSIGDPHDGEFDFNDGYDNTKETGSKFFENYHVGKSGTILTKRADGRYELQGNVFHSDRFTIIERNENGELVDVNYGERILDEAFDFLYGGATDKYLHTVPTTKGVRVELTDAQSEAIDRHLSAFIFAKIKESKERIEDSKDFIPSYLITDDNITEFALNHHIAFAAFNDLFEGDTKFYSSRQDFLKRAKESQGSGVPYGIADLNLDLTFEVQRVPSDLDKVKFTKKVKNEDGTITEETKTYELKDRFTGVTIINTVRVSDGVKIKGETYNGKKCTEDGEITKSLEKALIETGMSKKEARARTEELMKGMSGYISDKKVHKGTKVNDAQSYITFEEWIRRVTARGQLHRYIPLIEEILDETKPVSVETIKQFVQVQKNFYYDQHFNEETHTMAPRQIKNAEFVLVPRFIKGTQLEDVYNLMVEHGIDQLNTKETSKAGNSNVLTIWNEAGEITKENLDHFTANVGRAKELYDYNHLYTQQETKQHMNDENKAGIQIMKKIIDNIPDDPSHPLYEEKQKFFRLYTANILQSFEELMDEFDIETDKDGKLIVDDNGHIKGLDYQVFFDRLKEEIARLGLDSNSLDYVTLSDDNFISNASDGILAITNMPTYLSSFSVKLENIAQSLFNNRITRQKLPGFHAAQITGVGFHKKDGQISTSSALRYHPNGEPYVEVMLPASMFGLEWDGSEEHQAELLKQLEEKGLDKIIGYRIPTEGKQSIAVMKVVGFTNNAQGSTIVVADDWVTQTGSDFDIDSIYGITWAVNVNKDTNVAEKVPYLDDTSVPAYFSYVLKRLEKKPNTKTKKDIKKVKENAKADVEKEYIAAKEAEGAAYKVLDKENKEQYEIRKKIQELQRVDTSAGKSDLEMFQIQTEHLLEGLAEYREEIKDKVSSDTLAKLDNFIDKRKKLIDVASKSQEKYKELVGEGVEDVKAKKLKEVEESAVKHHLPTYEEFKKLHPDRRNNKKARDNELLQTMINIMSSPYSLEENLSRSNSDHIEAAMDRCIDSEAKFRREHRSPYNFFDQADSQDDVMSGAKLKAFSVTRDTFCSVCNTVRPFILEEHSFTVIYKSEDGYTYNSLKSTFGKDNVEKIDTGKTDSKGKTIYDFKVRHNTFGWTLNNRNSQGYLITPYTSETTAYILDAVKKGAIPNVNDLTFQVFKIFTDMGCDFDTAVAFIIQPGIRRIVNAYNKTKSIYSRTRANPIENAIKELAVEILANSPNELSSRASMDKAMEALQVYNEIIVELFGLSKEDKFAISMDDKQIGKLPISASMLRDRTNEVGKFDSSSPVGELNRKLFDLAVMLQYSKLSHFGAAIAEYARVCNPDRFGAKQSIYETNQVFDKINDILIPREVGSLHDIFTVKKNGKSINMLKAIYPGVSANIDEYISNEDMDSVYPPLHYFLKFSTATSIKINRMLFETQQKPFVDQIKALERLFSGRGKKMSVKQYRDLQNYILGRLYKSCDAICKNLIYSPTQHRFLYNGLDTNSEKEYRRIFGYDKRSDFKAINSQREEVEFEVQSLTHPTREEITLFATLSPAQKIEWIKRNAKYPSVFDFITTSLFNGTRTSKSGRQTIEFNEDTADIETVYTEFENAFFNDNPIIAMAAMDIVKYAFVVEGFKMRRKAVNKMIRNTALMKLAEDGGSQFVYQMNERISAISRGTMVDMDELRERYIRSHFKQIYQIPTKRVEIIKDNQGNRSYELPIINDGIIILKPGTNAEHNTLAEQYELIYDNKKNEKEGGFKYKVNKYVKLIVDNETVLYKIQTEDHDDEIVLYPLNALEETEHEDYSVNNENNKYPSSDYYKAWCDKYFNSENRSVVDVNAELKTLRSESIKGHTANTSMADVAYEFDFNDNSGPYYGGLQEAKEKIDKFFATHTTGDVLYLESIALQHYLWKPGISTTKEINGALYNLERQNKWTIAKNYLGDNIDKEIDIPNESLAEIVRNVRKRAEGINHKIDVVQVTVANKEAIRETINSENEDVRYSTITELSTDSMTQMYRLRASEGDPEAIKAIQILEDRGIERSSESIENNNEEIIRITAQFVENKTEQILNDLEYFVQDSSGVWHSVDDAVTINIIRNNPDERKRFLKTVLEAKAFAKNFALIDELDISSEDADIRHNLEKIKKCINDLKNATILNKAEETFMNEYLAKLSSNPHVKNDYLSLMEGYHTASTLDAWINDLQETTSPLIQIISKEVMADIRGKEMAARKDMLRFREELNRLKKLASDEGLSINWDNIIDEDGKFVQDFNKAFEEKLEEHRETVSKAKREANFETGDGVEAWVKAKLDYDEFKAKYIHQPAQKEYYLQRVEAEREAFETAKTAYCELRRLFELKRRILDKTSKGYLEEDDRKALRDINAQIADLVEDYIVDITTNTVIDKLQYDDPANIYPMGSAARRMYCIETAAALQKCLGITADLNDEYFEDESKYGFEEQRDKYLDIINQKEIRDSNGRLTVSMDDLMQDPKYVEAKTWIANNARYVLNKDTKDMLDKAFKSLKESSRGRRTLASLAKEREAYDNLGVVDARKFTDEDIDKIRQEQLDNYGIREAASYTDKRLISNATPDDTVFKSEFYAGMTLDGTRNSEYMEKVDEINKILRKYYYPNERIIHTHEISKEDLETLKQLYKDLSNIKKVEDPTNGRSVHRYIRRNVDFVTNDELFREQKALAEAKKATLGEAWYQAWLDLNQELLTDEDGNPILDSEGKAQFKPNRYIYGYAIPKGYKHDGSGDNSKVDVKRTEALKIIHEYYETDYTQYYYDKLREMRSKSDDEFNAWYDKNHIYNPYTHAMEPISCWTTLKVKPIYDDGEWVPNFNQKTRKVRDDKANSDYRQGLSHKANYAKGSGYDNIVPANKHEIAIKKLLQDTLRKYAKTTGANRFLDEGYMASKAKGEEQNAKFYFKQFAKFLGWSDDSAGFDSFRQDAEIDYAEDIVDSMPFLSLLKSKDSIEVNYRIPQRKDFPEGTDGDEAYNKALEDHKQEVKEAKAKNEEIHKDMLDRNWEKVMEEFIIKAGHFNAIQDNKYLLFFGKNVIDKLDTYIKYFGRDSYKKLNSKNADGTPKYATKKDTNLQAQYVNWVRRLVYDQWKEPNGYLTRAMNILQTFTSSKFMMLNITGGIANVSVGETNVIAEAFAREYFGKKYWAKGIGMWHKNIPSFIADMYSEKSTTLASAITKFFGVVDFDQKTGVVNIPDMNEYLKRARDIMFSPLSAGEHGMQNAALFSLLMSHKVIENKDWETNGRPKLELLNEAEYTRKCHEEALKSILDADLQIKFDKYIQYILKDPNKKKDYMRFRKDFTREFLDLYAKDKKKEFIARKNELLKIEKERFEKYPSVMDQLCLKDGLMDFKDDSIFRTIPESEAFKILGAFKGRTISINKKIHGIYDRLGSAKLESQFLGGVVMQYHKHIYPGIMKRYRTQGYYNEERGTIEKGCYTSIRDFLVIPLKNNKFAKELQEANGMTDMQLEATRGIQNIIKNYIDFILHLILNYQTLPDYEKANIRRCLGDFAGAAAALCLAIGVRVAVDDDDNGLLSNLFLYEADRLASESMMYNPLGLYAEGKKLWSSPTAVQGSISDTIHALGFVSQYIIQGDEFDPYYQSGLFAGENKLKVMIRRNIPVYHSIDMFTRLNRTNKYYKLGENILGVVPVNSIADWINE